MTSKHRDKKSPALHGRFKLPAISTPRFSSRFRKEKTLDPNKLDVKLDPESTEKSYSPSDQLESPLDDAHRIPSESETEKSMLSRQTSDKSLRGTDPRLAKGRAIPNEESEVTIATGTMNNPSIPMNTPVDGRKQYLIEKDDKPVDNTSHHHPQVTSNDHDSSNTASRESTHARENSKDTITPTRPTMNAAQDLRNLKSSQTQTDEPSIPISRPRSASVRQLEDSWGMSRSGRVDFSESEDEQDYDHESLLAEIRAISSIDPSDNYYMEWMKLDLWHFVKYAEDTKMNRNSFKYFKQLRHVWKVPPPEFRPLMLYARNASLILRKYLIIYWTRISGVTLYGLKHQFDRVVVSIISGDQLRYDVIDIDHLFISTLHPKNIMDAIKEATHGDFKKEVSHNYGQICYTCNRLHQLITTEAIQFMGQQDGNTPSLNDTNEGPSAGPSNYKPKNMSNKTFFGIVAVACVLLLVLCWYAVPAMFRLFWWSLSKVGLVKTKPVSLLAKLAPGLSDASGLVTWTWLSSVWASTLYLLKATFTL